MHDLLVMGRRLAEVGGVVGVALGGSRARGDHHDDSDYDVGIYYRGTLDTGALRAIAVNLADEHVEVSEPGEWGPWVDGGAWLTVGGRRVDWISRHLDRVRAVWTQCQHGTYEVAVQAGHPLGFASFAYAGELALARLLADPTGEVEALQRETSAYPRPLADAIVGTARWEVPFTLAIAAKGAARRDVVYVSGCLFLAVGLLAHALHAGAARWLINEKGAVDAAAKLPGAPPDFAERAHGLFRLPPLEGLRQARLLADEILG